MVFYTKYFQYFILITTHTGIKFHEADAWNFKLNGTLCPCGYARPELHNNPYIPGTYTSSGYYPGDVYDYYAVTLDPWDEALESDRSERVLMI